MTHRIFSDRHLQVAPDMIGLPLASPLRRAFAFGVDLAIVLLPSLAVAFAAVALSLHFSDPRALVGITSLIRGRALDVPARDEALQAVLPLLARIDAPGLPPAARAAIEDGNLEEVARILLGYDYEFSLQIGEFEGPPLKPKTIRIEMGEVIPKTVRFFALYGVAAVYFTLFASAGRGATPGKRLAGIRIARLDGHRLSLLESLERFVGYLHIPGTLGLSLLDLWRDPNRRLPHDRVVHTVVLRLPGKTVDTLKKAAEA